MKATGRELGAGIIALGSSLLILLFFTNFNITNILHITISIKPEYSSWAWMVFSFSSSLYLYVSSERNNREYSHPLFKRSLNLASLILFLGFLASFIPGTAENRMLKAIISASSIYLDTMLLFFVFINASVGISFIGCYLKYYMRKNKSVGI
jgi:hypothetical protein